MDLFEEVEEIMGQGEICDSCLGQIFADRGHGLTNRERGRAWTGNFIRRTYEMSMVAGRLLSNLKEAHSLDHVVPAAQASGAAVPECCGRGVA